MSTTSTALVVIPKTETSPYGNMEVLPPKIPQGIQEAFELFPSNKAAQIRHMYSEGYSVGAIHKVMKAYYGDFLYQHVYNTVRRPLKRG